MRTIWSLVVLSFVTFSAIPAQALEVTPMLTSRFIELDFDVGILCFVPPCPTGEVGDDSALGLIFDFEINEKLDFEVLYTRQSSSISPSGGLIFLFFIGEFELSIAQVGLRWTFGGGEWAPYAAAGLGVADVDVKVSFGFGHNATELAASLAAGVQRSLGERWGVRLEARAYWLDLPDTLGGSTTVFDLGAGLTLTF